MTDQYDEDYFINGMTTGKSLYKDYRWLPELTIPMACAMIRHLGIGHEDTICDYGCARGYTVKAFRQLGHDCFGVDLSKWAIDNCDPDVQAFVRHDTELNMSYDWIIAKDVLEHVEFVRMGINHLMDNARVGVFAVVPLSAENNQPYVVPSYEKDVTHIHRLTLSTWVSAFLRPDWSVEASYRVRGVKDNYYKPGWEKANGFITARRIK